MENTLGTLKLLFIAIMDMSERDNQHLNAT